MEAYMEGSAADLLRDNPFDSIEDLLDFPNEEDVLAMVDAHAEGASLAPVPVNSAGGCASVIAGGIHVRPSSIAGGEINSEEDALGLCNDMDITNLEWLSTFFEDSEFNFDFPTTAYSATGPNNGKDGFLFRSLSPTSVLEHNTLRGGGGGASYSSTSSCSSSNSGGGGDGMTARPSVSTTHTNALFVPARARTKRPRPQSFYTRSFVPPPSFDSVMITAPTRPTEPETVGECFPGPFKTRKKKKTIAALGTEVNSGTGAVTLPSPMVRKCLHCDIQKTPQWRAGPMGPKTLCNACGVRYKSGRLFPEYRPAASPTFVPSIHSNSHKKVVEMRLRATQVAADKDGMRLIEGTVAAKNCDLLEYIRRRD